MINKILDTDHSKTTILIRLMVGVVFLSEGIQKFLFPVLRGAGRFEKIGLPSPEFLGGFVGTFEILCGTLILLGLLTRLLRQDQDSVVSLIPGLDGQLGAG